SFDYAACMLGTRYEVGIDMELVKPKIEVIASKFMKPEELAQLQPEHHYVEQLLTCWTAKEAVYKLQGKKGVSFKDNIYIEPFTYQERSEEHTSELQSRENLVCRLLLEKKKKKSIRNYGVVIF